MKKWISAILIGLMVVMSAPNMARANGCGGGGGGGGALNYTALRALAQGKPMWFVMYATLFDLLVRFYVELTLQMFFALWPSIPAWAVGLAQPPAGDGCFFCGRSEVTDEAAGQFVFAFFTLGGAHPEYKESAQDSLRKGVFGEALNGGFEGALTPRIGFTYDIGLDGKTTARPSSQTGEGLADRVLGNPFAPDGWPFGEVGVSPYARPDMTNMPHFGGFSQTAQVVDAQETEQQKALRDAAAKALADPVAMEAARQFGSDALRAEIDRQLNGGTSPGSSGALGVTDHAEENAAPNTITLGLRVNF